jgi:tetratricopeptide (TPR) repeat protein
MPLVPLPAELPPEPSLSGPIELPDEGAAEPLPVRPTPRWPLWLGGTALAFVAFWYLVLHQPPTDKKDAPWLERATAPSRAPAEPAPPPKPAPRAPPVSTTSVAPSVPPPAPTPPVAAPKPPAAAVKARPDDYTRAMSAGEALLKRGRYRQAATEFKRAVAANATSVPALLSLGDAYLEGDSPRDAIKPLQQAARLDPRNGRAQLLLGTAHQSLRNNRDAIAAYQRYLQIEPSGEFSRDVRSILADLQR